MWTSLHPTRFSRKTSSTTQIEFSSKTKNLTPRVRKRIASSTIPCAEAQASKTPSLEEIRVDVADMKIETRPVLLITNVGSCVAICVHDSINKWGGLAHVMLPRAKRNSNELLPYKYAETAVPALAESLRKLGKGKARLSAKIAGGANMFTHLKCPLFSIGAKNVEAVREALAANRVRLLAEDVEGTSGRRVSFNVVTGVVYTKRLDGRVKRI